MFSSIKYFKNYGILTMKDGHLLINAKKSIQLFNRWRKSLHTDPLNEGGPWIAFEAQDFITSLLKTNFEMFEYGSGGSTLFYSQRVKYLISIEHDFSWHNIILGKLKDKNIKNCSYRLILPEQDATAGGDYSNPAHYNSGDEKYAGYSFRNYVLIIDHFPDEFFDFISIDGRSRPACLIHAAQKVKIGGYLLLDNSDREYYKPAQDTLRDWEKHVFTGPTPYGSSFSTATVWRKTGSNAPIMPKQIKVLL